MKRLRLRMLCEALWWSACRKARILTQSSDECGAPLSPPSHLVESTPIMGSTVNRSDPYHDR